MTLVVCALVVADVLWTIGTLAYVEFRFIEERTCIEALFPDPDRLTETRRRIMERIAADE